MICIETFAQNIIESIHTTIITRTVNIDMFCPIVIPHFGSGCFDDEEEDVGVSTRVSTTKGKVYPRRETKYY